MSRIALASSLVAVVFVQALTASGQGLGGGTSSPSSPPAPEALAPAAAAASVGGPGSPGAFPTEESVEAFVRAYVKKYCKDVAASCAEAKSIQSGYLKDLVDAKKCGQSACGVSELLRIAGDAARLDAREEALPYYPSLGHPLLRLAVMISARLGAAFAGASARDHQEYAVPQLDPGSDAERSLAIEKACLEKPQACDVLHASNAEAMSAVPEIVRCRKGPCSFDEAERLLRSAGGTMNRFLMSDGNDVMPLFELLEAEENISVGLLQKEVDRRLAELNAGADGLSRTLDGIDKGAPADPASLRSDSDALFSRFRDASVGEDRINYYLGYDKDVGAAADAGRAEINEAAARLSGLRARALAVLTARGLSLNDSAGSVSPSVSPSSGGGGARAAAAIAHPSSRAPATPNPTLIDARTVPSPAVVGAAPPPAPPIIAGAASGRDLLNRLSSGDPTQEADAERRLGLTRTYGQPGVYAAQAFEQEGASSCGVASQVEVLRVHGLLPSNVPPNAQEAQMVAEAKKDGFIMEGTPPEFDGELLINHGLLVAKSAHATLADLEGVLRRGNIAQVGVDARFLWAEMDMTKPLPHSILVTGMEVNRVTGAVLGFYVNDTGSIVPGAGRFEPAAKFGRAFDGDIAEIR
jgi:hypothetical protein